MNNNLRERVRLFKAKYLFPYSQIAAMLMIPSSSFYNWLNGQYELSEKRQKILEEFINRLGGTIDE